MVYTSLGPAWFETYGIIFEIIFILITGLIALRSYRAYKLIKKKELLTFTLSFGLFCLAFFTQFIINLLIVLNKQSKDHLLSPLNTLNTVITSNFQLSSMCYFFFSLFTICGLLLFIYLTFEIRNRRLLLLLFVLVVLAQITAINKIVLFYVFSTIFYGFIVEFYYRKKIKVAFLGFVFL
ncbi:hypothetical protein HOK68_01425, partial [Candidatus Woesearchaeota archaeon]|nr:hypothetical protein [Candidatus Woesearchaeota archaeon]